MAHRGRAPHASYALGALLLLALSSAGCAPDIDPPSELSGLRVLAVQKDKPYAKPTDSVTLTMLHHDTEGRDVQVWWHGGCRNPPGDLFYLCLLGLDATAFEGGPNFDQFVLNNQPGDDDIPDDIIQARPPSSDPRFPSYGLIYVFFVACTGVEIRNIPQNGEQLAFPIGCFDANGNQLGPKDFVAGYTSIYVYDEFTNANPTPADDFLVAGQHVADSNDLTCANCTTPPPDPPDCAGSTSVSSHCVQACPDDGELTCPEIPILPVIDPSQAEVDAVSAAAYGREVGEQMWINYYVDGGSVDSVARLVNDATKGWNPDFGTKFRAPAVPGPVNIWAVVHDNRGGVGWSRVTLNVF
jgi:hypothetical protein